MSRAGPTVVSLVPSITETLLAWGIRPAAVTRFCEAPGIPTVGGTKNPDIGAIVGLRPDVVLMDEEENRQPDAVALREAGVTVVATRVRSLEDVDPALRAIAAAAGLEPPAADADLPVAEVHTAVFVPIWRRPWMTIGAATYGTSILRAAGFDNLYGHHDDPYPVVELDEVATRSPQLVLVPSEPYAFKDRHLGELEAVAPCRRVDGQDLFWWGARTPRAVERVRGMARSAPCQDPSPDTES